MKFSQEQLHEMFEYRDGNLYWKITPDTKKNRIKIGDKANRLNSDYIGDPFDAVSMNSTAYRANKLIYMMFHGFTPRIITHIDGDRTNNKIENLSHETKSQLKTCSSKKS